MQLSKQELETFDEFTNWLDSNDWLAIKSAHDLITVVYADSYPDSYILTATHLVNRILDNLKLREHTRDVLVKIQYALDIERTKRGLV